MAVSDAEGQVATPVTVIERSGRSKRDHQMICELVADYGVGVVVVGFPKSMDGSIGKAAQAVEREVGELSAVLAVPVLTHDERLTTVIAERSLAEAGLNAKARRQRVDMVAATVILQGWLDAVSQSRQ